ncbi:hypothetical protein BIT28_01775 [Photobacterium proteolyticum]|uniref:Dystroglycan-type cadherin-like domain-containing protein n=1 Tax=Photobacterium proteolyticum TaxID=1903952 RepID=A0A1Q9GVI7_9GAMM|nr:Ig domain-containing protein [Photobacterium proteolyticum]OLQ79092.1 hypothetical protein BIT28_01775 [Photobacterium proteolyticum]
MLRAKLSLAICMAIGLTSCGGGSGGGDGKTTPAEPSVPQVETKPDFSVLAIDGYLHKALVCEDINLDLQCSDEELLGRTDENGRLKGKRLNENAPLLVTAVPGMTIDSDRPNQTVDHAFAMYGLPGQVAVTPYTHLAYSLAKESAAGAEITQSMFATAQADVEAMMKRTLLLDQHAEMTQVWGDYISARGSSSGQELLAQIHFVAKLMAKLQSQKEVVTDVSDYLTAIPGYQSDINSIDWSKPVPEVALDKDGQLNINYSPTVNLDLKAELEMELEQAGFIQGEEYGAYLQLVEPYGPSLFNDDKPISFSAITLDTMLVNGLTLTLTSSENYVQLAVKGVAEVAGAVSIPLTYTDSDGVKAKLTLDFEVKPSEKNLPPVVNQNVKAQIDSDIANQTWQQKQPVSINTNALFSDPEGKELIITANLPAGLSYNPDTGLIQGEPTIAGAGQIISLIAQEATNRQFVDVQFSVPEILPAKGASNDLIAKLESQPYYLVERHSVASDFLHSLACKQVTFANGKIHVVAGSSDCEVANAESTLLGEYQVQDGKVFVTYQDDGRRVSFSEYPQPDMVWGAFFILEQAEEESNEGFKKERVLRFYDNTVAAEQAGKRSKGQFLFNGKLESVEARAYRYWDNDTTVFVSAEISFKDRDCYPLFWPQSLWDKDQYYLTDIVKASFAIEGYAQGTVTTSVAHDNGFDCIIKASFAADAATDNPLAQLMPLNSAHFELKPDWVGEMEAIVLSTPIGQPTWDNTDLHSLDLDTYYIVATRKQNETSGGSPDTQRNELYKVTSQGDGSWHFEQWQDSQWALEDQIKAVSYHYDKSKTNARGILVFGPSDSWIHDLSKAQQELYTKQDPSAKEGAILGAPDYNLGRIYSDFNNALMDYEQDAVASQ